MAHYYTRELSKDENGEHRKLRLNIDSLSTVRPKAKKGQPEQLSDREIADKHGLKDGMSFHPDGSTHEQAHWGLKLQAKYTDKIKCGFGGGHGEKRGQGRLGSRGQKGSRPSVSPGAKTPTRCSGATRSGPSSTTCSSRARPMT